MKPRHPIAGLEHRRTPELENRLQLVLAGGLICAAALVVILALIVATK